MHGGHSGNVEDVGVAGGDGDVVYGSHSGDVEDVGVVVINGSVCVCWFYRRGHYLVASIQVPHSWLSS